MKKVAVITIHGMGDTKRGYANQIRRDLSDRVGNNVWSNDIHFFPIYFQDKLQANQEAVWNRTKPHVDWMKLRKFLLYGFSDAASLESKKQNVNSKYNQVQQLILDALMDAYDALGQRAGPVVLIAHSLGCQVMSNYLWDATRSGGAKMGIWKDQPPGIPAGSALNRIARGKTVKRFFTTGCNIPIFVSGHDVIKPIPKLNNDFQWHNYYDEDDVLGWPLKPLSDEYRNRVKDHEMNAGGIFKSWNPMSHGGYWKDNDFLAPVSSYIRSLI